MRVSPVVSEFEGQVDVLRRLLNGACGVAEPGDPLWMRRMVEEGKTRTDFGSRHARERLVRTLEAELGELGRLARRE